jgi:hypothetical protein
VNAKFCTTSFTFVPCGRQLFGTIGIDGGAVGEDDTTATTVAGDGEGAELEAL